MVPEQKHGLYSELYGLLTQLERGFQEGGSHRAHRLLLSGSSTQTNSVCYGLQRRVTTEEVKNTISGVALVGDIV